MSSLGCVTARPAGCRLVGTFVAVPKVPPVVVVVVAGFALPWLNRLGDPVAVALVVFEAVLAPNIVGAIPPAPTPVGVGAVVGLVAVTGLVLVGVVKRVFVAGFAPKREVAGVFEVGVFPPKVGVVEAEVVVAGIVPVFVPNRLFAAFVAGGFVVVAGVFPVKRLLEVPGVVVVGAPNIGPPVPTVPVGAGRFAGVDVACGTGLGLPKGDVFVVVLVDAKPVVLIMFGLDVAELLLPNRPVAPVLEALLVAFVLAPRLGVFVVLAALLPNRVGVREFVVMALVGVVFPNILLAVFEVALVLPNMPGPVGLAVVVVFVVLPKKEPEVAVLDGFDPPNKPGLLLVAPPNRLLVVELLAVFPPKRLGFVVFMAVLPNRPGLLAVAPELLNIVNIDKL